MAPTIGFGFLLLVFSIGVFLPFFNFVSLNKVSAPDHLMKNIELERISKILIFIIFLCALFSQVSLIFSFVISDYSVSNVYQNSHHLKPLIYKISGAWGNHEGSMLLLISILSAYSLAFAILSKIPPQKKVIIISSQAFIIAAFAAFTAFTSNPFARIFPAPQSGLGLNPLLQDIGLALHPPMLYTGYIGFSLVFSFALAGLILEKIDDRFAYYLKSWLFFSWGFLSLGIGLGSWWAYRELGWGGYWFWDPVENISLMPWLAATALIHCLMALEKKQIFKTWTAFLAILSFILCLLGIFLTRSGILTSVHSFAIDASRGFFVIILIALIGGIGALIFGFKAKKLQDEKAKFHPTSKISALLVNNYFLVLALFIVVLGTLYPIFSQSIFDQFISIGPTYYNKLFTILIIPFLLFLAISYQLHYLEKTNLQKIISRRNSAICLTAALITLLTIFYQKSADFSQIVVLFLAILAALLTANSSAKNLKHFPTTAAHLGFAIIVIGIVLTSSFGSVKEVNIKQGQELEIAGYNIKFKNVEYIAGKNFLARQGAFQIYKNDKLQTTLKPQLRYYPVSNQTTNEAAISHRFFGDIYLAIGQKDENDFYALRAYYKPFIYLIWLGCAMMFAGAMVKIILLRRKA